MTTNDTNGHGVSATPENVSRYRHDRFPHPGPLPEGEGDSERAARDFHGNGEKEVAPTRRAKTGAAAGKPAQSREATSETGEIETVPPVPEQAATRDTYRSAGRVWPD
jgi:hypothetical protein